MIYNNVDLIYYLNEFNGYLAFTRNGSQSSDGLFVFTFVTEEPFA